MTFNSSLYIQHSGDIGELQPTLHSYSDFPIIQAIDHKNLSLALKFSKSHGGLVFDRIALLEQMNLYFFSSMRSFYIAQGTHKSGFVAPSFYFVAFYQNKLSVFFLDPWKGVRSLCYHFIIIPGGDDHGQHVLGTYC